MWAEGSTTFTTFHNIVQSFMTTRIYRKTAGFHKSVIVWQEVGTAYPNYPQRFRLSVIKAKLLFTAGIQPVNKLNI